MRLLLAAALVLLAGPPGLANPVSLQFSGVVTDIPTPGTSEFAVGDVVTGVWTYDDEPPASLVSVITFDNPLPDNDPTVYPGLFEDEQSTSIVEAVFSAGVIDVTVGSTFSLSQPSAIIAIGSASSAIQFIGTEGSPYQVIAESRVQDQLSGAPQSSSEAIHQEGQPWLQLDFTGFEAHDVSIDTCIGGDAGVCFRSFYDPINLTSSITGTIGFDASFEVPAARFQITGIAVVPEPAMLGLVVTFAALPFRRRR